MQALENVIHKNRTSNPSLAIIQTQIQKKKRILKLQWNENHSCDVKTENTIYGCCSKSIQFI